MRYLVALWDGGGTVPVELGVVRRLRDRGHVVTVLADATLAGDVASTGATFRPWRHAPQRLSTRPEDDLFKDWECRTPLQQFGRVRDRLVTGPAASFAADVRDALANGPADAVIADGALLGALVGAESLGVPAAALCPNIYIRPARGMPPLGLGLPPAKSVLGRTRDTVLNALIRSLWNKGLADLNRARTEVGLDLLEETWAQWDRARRVLVLTSPAFDLPADLPANVRYTGPVLDDPPWAEPLEEPPGSDPLVVVSLSSSYTRQLPSLNRIAEALGRLPVRSIITTGPAVDPSDVSATGRVRVVRSAPHESLFTHASVVVTHAGHGTLIKALAAGVPCLCMPEGRDQLDNARRATLRGTSLVLRRTASPARIAGAVRRLLEDPSYRANARTLGERLRADADGTILVRELENLDAALQQ